MKIVVVTPRKDELQDFAAALEAQDSIALFWAQAFESGLEVVKTETPEVVILDATLSEKDGKDFLMQLLQVNAMINTAVISPLKEADFHERTEGLGVLARLPFNPEAQDAGRLLKKLAAVGLKF